jgi:hypothetical protein
VKRGLPPTLANGFHQRQNLIGHHASIPRDRVEPDHTLSLGDVEGDNAVRKFEFGLLFINMGTEGEKLFVKITVRVQDANAVTLQDQIHDDSGEKEALANAGTAHYVHVGAELLGSDVDALFVR